MALAAESRKQGTLKSAKAGRKQTAESIRKLIINFAKGPAGAAPGFSASSRIWGFWRSRNTVERVPLANVLDRGSTGESSPMAFEACPTTTSSESCRESTQAPMRFRIDTTDGDYVAFLDDVEALQVQQRAIVKPLGVKYGFSKWLHAVIGARLILEKKLAWRYRLGCV